MDMTKYMGTVFLKVDDVRAGPIRVTIKDVTEGRYGKPDLTFSDGTQLSCNTSNVRTLVRAYGAESNDLIDKEIELARGEVEYQGKMQEAIIVKPISPPINASLKPDLNDDIPF